MEEREEEYQQANEGIYTYDVRGVLSRRDGGWGPCCTNICVLSLMLLIILSI